MLVLSRKVGQSIQIGDDITITVLKTGSIARLGIDAPEDCVILRNELERFLQEDDDGENDSDD